MIAFASFSLWVLGAPCGAGHAQDSMAAQIIGDEIELAFNVRYLLDGLKALPSTEIQMQLNEATQPVIFTPLGGVKMTYLVMPVQLRD